MQINITFLSIVLAFTSTGFGRSSNSTRFGLMAHELHQEEPAQSDLSTLSVETSTQSPTRRRTPGTLRHTVTRVHTVLETIRTTSTIAAATQDTSMCLHTHSAEGSGFMTHMMPCSLTGMALAPPAPTSTISAPAEGTPMCAHTHTQNGTAFFTHTIACSLTNRPMGGDNVYTELPFSHVPCTTCDTLTSTITRVDAGVTTLATTTKTINRVCPTCNWSLINETHTLSGINTVTYTTEVWRFPETTLPTRDPNAAPYTTQTMAFPIVSKTFYITRRAESTSVSA
ncbi:hypothetical protein BKA65DRAFT_566320 [Rhexocercosporidium sp. MPI-PUGE-AT-0058]|nr:hypothetical protein BKA65DRAFT_566320 [Rhexocercosporidium sp. MPI-PUGE-AT-0058]